MIMPLIIFGGILGVFLLHGIGCRGCRLRLIIGVFIFKEISFRELQNILVKTSKVTGWSCFS